MTDIVVVVENQPEIVVVVQEGGAALTPSTIGPALSVLVANIDDPTTELAAIPGTLPAATLIIARQSRADADEVTLYLLDTASSDAAETPWRVNRTLGGQWIAVGGKYSNRQRRPVSSTDNTVARMDGTTGNLQGSGVTIDDSDNITGVAALTCSGILTAQGLGAHVLGTLGTGGKASLFLEGGNSGTNTGAQLAIRNNGSIIAQIGNLSAVTGAAYDGRCYFYSPVDILIGPVGAGLEIKSAGRVLIAGATDDTTSALQVQGAGRFTGGVTFAGGGAGAIRITNGGVIDGPGNGSAFIRGRNAADSAYVDLLYMDATDRAVIPRALSVTGPLSLSAGLTFGDETLSTYDEGTWTPTILGDGTAGSHTYSEQVGAYIRIGKMVLATFNVRISSKDAAMAGNIRIGGLPFTTGSAVDWSGAITATNDVTFGAQIVARGLAGSTRVGIANLVSGGGFTDLVAGDLGSTPRFYGFVIYQVN